MTQALFFAILTVLIELTQLRNRGVMRLVNINYRDPRPIYEQVKDSFQHLILSGILRPDEKMPSVRELAGQLAINPNTIHRAYRELEQEGYICSVPGKGSFVADASDAMAMRRSELLEQLGKVSEELKRLGISEETQINYLRGGTEHD